MKNDASVVFSIAASADLANALATQGSPTGAFDFRDLRLKVLSSDAKQTVGAYLIDRESLI